VVDPVNGKLGGFYFRPRQTYQINVDGLTTFFLPQKLVTKFELGEKRDAKSINWQEKSLGKLPATVQVMAILASGR